MTTFDIVLGGQTYVVKAFNLRQLRQVVKFTQALPAGEVAFEVLAMALKTADPPVEDAGELQPLPGEFQTAMAALMEGAGLAPKGEAQPPGTGATSEA